MPPTAATSAFLDFDSSYPSAPSLLFSRLGFGGILGLCAGYAVKQAGKVAMVVLGAGVVFLQGMQYAGYIEVKWDKLERDATLALDTDGSGTLGMKDFEYYQKRLLRAITYQGPGACVCAARPGPGLRALGRGGVCAGGWER
jgi:uncharacterized membrane protein (Fun14 family)